MRRLILLLLFIVGCTSEITLEEPTEIIDEEVLVEEPQEVIEEQIDEPTVDDAPSEPPAKEVVFEEAEFENWISIGDQIRPANKQIIPFTELTWHVDDDREHRMACYLRGKRMAQSEIIGKGQSFSYEFIEEGEYTCIDAIYGLRSYVQVGEPVVQLSPTGSAVAETADASILGAIIVMMLVAGSVLGFYLYLRK